MVKNVGKNYFKKFFEDKTNPHVVKLFSDDCQVCHDLAPDYEKLSNELGNYTFVKFDVDADSKVSDLLAPNGVPTIYLFKDGDLFEIGYGDNGYDYDYLKESILNEINLKKDGE
jgi:thioredoxin-like negative regulator of GroEL|tara:strand:+ start:2127 stop:2468 length:342 start_codon:yes stop_codon:yes gene_type:complete